MLDKATFKKIEKALLKRALGYDCSETVEEYAKNGEDLTMVRKKITTKNVPPDISAAKILLENIQEDNNLQNLQNLSNEQLNVEKARLLALLKEKSNSEIN